LVFSGGGLVLLLEVEWPIGSADLLDRRRRNPLNPALVATWPSERVDWASSYVGRAETRYLPTKADGPVMLTVGKQVARFPRADPRVRC
jgi:hypothetical protein